MYYIIYKTIHENGKYYIGRHQTTNLNDNYLGSGKWILSIKDKSSLSRKILAETTSIEQSSRLEELYIARHINDPLNMNFKKGSIGNTSDDVSGGKHPLYISTVFEFVNIDGRIFNGTYYELRNKYPEEKFTASILSVVNKVDGRKSVGNGWYLRREDIPKTYTFKHTSGVVETNITQYDMLKKYPNIRAAEFSRLISRKKNKQGKVVRSTRGWTLVDNINYK